jgi:hypothetical protein
MCSENESHNYTKYSTLVSVVVTGCSASSGRSVARAAAVAHIADHEASQAAPLGETNGSNDSIEITS